MFKCAERVPIPVEPRHECPTNAALDRWRRDDLVSGSAEGTGVSISSRNGCRSCDGAVGAAAREVLHLPAQGCIHIEVELPPSCCWIVDGDPISKVVIGNGRRSEKTV